MKNCLNKNKKICVMSTLNTANKSVNFEKLRQNVEKNPYKERRYNEMVKKSEFDNISVKKMVNSCEPWYQSQGISRNEVGEALFEYFKFKVTDFDMLVQIIDKIIKETNDYGSYRGYYTFLHTSFKEKIAQEIEYRSIKLEKKNTEDKSKMKK